MFKRILKFNTDDGEAVAKSYGTNTTDELPFFQSPLMQYIDVNQSTHRYKQIRGNSVAYKHTYGLTQKLLGKRPLPFTYVKVVDKEPKPLAAMDRAHKLWEKDDMFTHLEKAFATALGVNTAFIVKMADGKFRIFNTSHVLDYWRDPITRKIIQIKLSWPASGGGKIMGKETILEAVPLYVTVGVDCVMIQPLPDVDDIWGFANITPIWNMIIFKFINKHYNMVFNKKGGIGSRVLIGPDNITPTWRQRFEKEAKKGLESELIEMYYNSALLKQMNKGVDPSKMVQWVENKAGEVNFQAFDQQLSQDSLLPPSFIDGPKVGSMGGVNAAVDDQEINEIASHYFAMIIVAIKDINNIFYGIEGDYSVIPFLQPKDDAIKPTGSKNLAERTEENADGQKPEEEQTVKTHSMKFHSTMSMDNVWVYEGNLWEEGWYQYDDHMEYLPPEEIIKFVDDPNSVKQGYVSIEHIGEEVPKHMSVARYETYGYTIDPDSHLLKDQTRVFFTFDPLQDEMDVSPVYGSFDRHENGAIIQTSLDLRNVAITSAPRSALTGKETKIKRKGKKE